MSVETDPKSSLAARGAASRFVFAVALLLVLAFLISNSAHAGYAALLTARAASTNNVGAAEAAVGLSPGNADAQLILGALLEAYDDRPAAMTHYQTAIALRPDDYVLWLQLARAQELEGDSPAAVGSARIAVNLAPVYAQPHWQLGNILVRAGQNDEGFKELRLAGGSDPNLLPAIVDLAWQVSGGDVEFVKQVIAPAKPAEYLALGTYLEKRDKVAEAIAMFAAAGRTAEAVGARRQYLAELITAKKFREAYQLWIMAHDSSAGSTPGVLVDPGFERESDLDEPGFGWRTTNPARSLTLSLDNTNAKEGRMSLRVDFNGSTDAGAPVISQIVLVEPKTHYQLGLAFRTEGLLSGGLPNVLVIDLNDNKVSGQTTEFPQTTDGWRDAMIDFTTGESTTAIQIALQRQPCSTSPCPIFGQLWLDNFFLQKQ
jgi:tetratricopeptide (TPR) repeat protein